MSISSYNSTTGELTTYAGSPNVDQVLSASSKNPIANKAVYNALAEKIEKTVNDLVNYYTTSQVYNKAEVRELIGAINTLTIAVVSTLPTSDISTTTIYFVGPATGTNTYDEYVYVNNTWVKIGDTDIDLTDYITSSQLTTVLQDYYTKSAVNALLDSYYTKTEMATTYYDKTDVDDLLDDKQDTLTFDNTPTAGSSNPVTSGGIKTALDTKQDSLTFDNTPTEDSANVVKSGGVYSAIDDVYKVMGENGAKNLLPFVYNQNVTHTQNCTASENNGIVTYTPSGIYSRMAYAYSGVLKIGVSYRVRFKAKFTKVGDPLSYALRSDYAWEDSGNYVFQIIRSSTSDYVTIDEIFTATSEDLYLLFYVARGNSYSDNKLEIKELQINLASDTDSTYQPYAETNYQLTQNKMSYADNGILGAKNLLPFNLTTIKSLNTASDGWNENTYTRYGISFTVNNDGTVTVNGTSTDTTFLIYASELSFNNVILNGCFSDGSNNTYKLSLFKTNSPQYNDYGDSVTISSISGYELRIVVYAGQTLTNAVFKPMIRLASDADSTYQPYAMTNRELTSIAEKTAGHMLLKPSSNDSLCFTYSVVSDGVKSYSILLKELYTEFLARLAALNDNEIIRPASIYVEGMGGALAMYGSGYTKTSTFTTSSYQSIESSANGMYGYLFELNNNPRFLLWKVATTGNTFSDKSNTVPSAGAHLYINYELYQRV